MASEPEWYLKRTKSGGTGIPAVPSFGARSQWGFADQRGDPVDGRPEPHYNESIEAAGFHDTPGARFR